MLNIYYGSEKTDKEKFIFSHIKGRTLLLVPDQFSLQAERDAFFYLGKKALMDLRIVDFSALGNKAVKQVGGKLPTMIDKYGRHMLLAGIIDELADELTVYRHLKWKNSFIELMNGMISELKRFGAGPQDVATAIATLEDDSFLKYKLTDIEKIFTRYQAEIEGKYLDSEDYIDFYGEKLLQAEMIRESEIWLYGFDTFTPKNYLVIRNLIKAARNVNVVMTYEDKERYSLTGYVMKKLEETAAEAGKEFMTSIIDAESRYTVADKVREYIENRQNSTDTSQDFPVTITETASVHEEIEASASYILHLVRDCGYRYGDIAVICNDIDERGSMLKRLLYRWNIPVFTDRKRKVMHHAATGFVMALIDVAVDGYRSNAIMRIIKSELSGIAAEDGELLENYVKEYKIKDSRWKMSFDKGSDRYSKEELDKINEVRERAVFIAENVKDAIGRRNSAASKIKGLYDFLENGMNITEKLKKLMKCQESFGLTEAAAETAQSWNVICGIFNQIVEITGEMRISNKNLRTLLKAGFEEVEIGLVPTSSDCITIGTLQRTRLSRKKVLMMIGTNEGIMPLEVRGDTLLNEREKERLESLDFEFSKRDSISRQEEEMALYRALSVPEERFYISCSKSDSSGEEARPADIFIKIKSKLEKYGVSDDFASSAQFAEISSVEGSLGKAADKIGKYLDGDGMPRKWLNVINWFDEKKPELIKPVRSGLYFNNRYESLGEEFADALYRGNREQITVSASQLEKYSGCPFAYFIDYGLRPDELRTYEIGAREIGDIYHECLMIFSRRLNDSAGGAYDNVMNSGWMNISREECRAEIERILREDMKSYREGLIAAGRMEAYKVERIAEICDRVAWALIGQVRKGKIEKMLFEEPFGNGCRIPGITVKAGKRDVLIRGKIDRLDIIGGDVPSIRIIDYKTGSDSVDSEYFRKGYKLQLMVYLDAGMNLDKQRELKPAGVFYFKIKDMDTNADMKKIEDGEATFNERIESAYRLEGIMVDDPRLIESMDESQDDPSTVVPVKISRKDGKYVAAAGGELLAEEDFAGLYEQVRHHVENICRDICAGKINAEPKREKKKDMDGNYRSACRYCGYKSICMFDTSFDGCRYVNV